jgi:hypothetical protein
MSERISKYIEKARRNTALAAALGAGAVALIAGGIGGHTLGVENGKQACLENSGLSPFGSGTKDIDLSPSGVKRMLAAEKRLFDPSSTGVETSAIDGMLKSTEMPNIKKSLDTNTFVSARVVAPYRSNDQTGYNQAVHEAAAVSRLIRNVTDNPLLEMGAPFIPSSDEQSLALSPGMTIEIWEPDCDAPQ